MCAFQLFLAWFCSGNGVYLLAFFLCTKLPALGFSVSRGLLQGSSARRGVPQAVHPVFVTRAGRVMCGRFAKGHLGGAAVAAREGNVWAQRLERQQMRERARSSISALSSAIMISWPGPALGSLLCSSRVSRLCGSGVDFVSSFCAFRGLIVWCVLRLRLEPSLWPGL